MSETPPRSTALLRMKIPQAPYGLIFGGLSAVGAVGVFLANSFYNVDGGHRAVMFSRLGGTKDEVINPGTHFKIPFIQYPHVYDVRAKPHVYTSLTGSKDLQMVNITLRVLSKPIPSELPRIHREIGPDYDERVLPSICNEVLKGTVAQFNASELITQRSEVSLFIGRSLRQRAHDFFITLDDVSITHLKFGTEFSRAVEEKKVAQQDAERAMILVEKAHQEKEGLIIRAQGQAQSAALIGKAARNNPGYLELMRIDNAKKISAALAKSGNRIYLNADNLLLNLLGHKKLDLEEGGSDNNLDMGVPTVASTSAVAHNAAPVPINLHMKATV